MTSDIAITMFSVYTEHNTRRILLTSDIQLWLKELRENTISYSDNKNGFNKGQKQLTSQSNSKTVNNFHDELKIDRTLNVTNSKTKSSHFPNNFDSDYVYKSNKFNVNVNNVNCDKLNESKTIPKSCNKISEFNIVDVDECCFKKEDPIYENIWEYRSKNQELSNFQSKPKSDLIRNESSYGQTRNITDDPSFNLDYEYCYQNTVLEDKLYKNQTFCEACNVDKILNQIDEYIDDDSSIFYYENVHSSTANQESSICEQITGVSSNFTNSLPRYSDICETNFKDNNTLSLVAKNMDISHININSKIENTKPWKTYSNKSEIYNSKHTDSKNINSCNLFTDECKNPKSNHSSKSHNEKETVITHSRHSKPSISNISSHLVNNNVKVYQNVAEVLLHENDNVQVETINYNNNEKSSSENITNVNNTTASNVGELYQENKKKPIAAPRRSAPKRLSMKEEPIYANLPVKPKVPPKINVTLVKSAETTDVCKICKPTQAHITEQHSNDSLTLDSCGPSKQSIKTVESTDVTQRTSPTFQNVKINTVNRLSSFKPESKVDNINFAKEIINESVQFERPLSMLDSSLVNESNISSICESIRPRKNSITSNVLNWACDLFENYESEPDYNKMEESNFQKPQEEVVQQNLYDNINLRNSKLRFSDRKSVKSANIIIDNVKLLRTEEHPLPESELVIKKEGALEQVKLIIENKKCKRWSNSYVLLTNHALFVFKDKQDVDKMKSGAKGHYDHVKLDLKSCTTKVENHPKKSVFVVSNEVQTQVHIQHDMLSWKTLIEEVISSLTPNINNSSSVEDLNRSGSIKEQTKIKIKLKNFFSGPRTPVEVLTKRGIYRDEPIFASSLETLCSQQPRPKVPEFVKKCIKAIEPHLDTDGLYRASGNLSQVQKIRLQVDQNDFSNVNVEKTDIHVLTGALKLFFRELQTPLIPNDKYDKCIEACNKEKTKQANALSSVVNRLPSSHRDTLQYLIGHLIDVSKHEASNRMDISNVATVWAPNILQGTMNNVKQDMLYHCSMQMRVVEIMLTNYASVFGCKKEDFDKNFVSK